MFGKDEPLSFRYVICNPLFETLSNGYPSDAVTATTEEDDHEGHAREQEQRRCTMFAALSETVDEGGQ